MFLRPRSAMGTWDFCPLSRTDGRRHHCLSLTSGSFAGTRLPVDSRGSYGPSSGSIPRSWLSCTTTTYSGQPGGEHALLCSPRVPAWLPTQELPVPGTSSSGASYTGEVNDGVGLWPLSSTPSPAPCPGLRPGTESPTP